MNTDKNLTDLNLLTEQVIGAVHEVSNQLGSGFLEKVYENALALELSNIGLKVAQQSAMDVCYKSRVVGSYVADLVVEECLLVEVKAVQGLDRVHQAQCINYLKASGKRLCLLVNFGRPKAEVKRIVWG